MKNWAYLFQKEGDRSWYPLKNAKIKIVEGKYRLVAHSSLSNADVNIRISHQTMDEVPPKRRSQKRSQRTTPDGLVIILPFTMFKPGIWEISCTGNISTDAETDIWEKTIELLVLPKAPEILVEQPQNATETNIEADLEPPAPTDIPAELPPQPESTPVIPEIETVQESEPDISVEEDIYTLESEPTPASIKPLIRPSFFSPYSPGNYPETAQYELEPSQDTESDASDATPDDLKERSLQMAEQILQQLLEPIWLDLEPTESSKTQNTKTSPALAAPVRYPVVPKKPQPITDALTLTLDEETLVSHQGESLTISGAVEVLNAREFVKHEVLSGVNSLFKGALVIELRDPQNLEVLLNVRRQLPKHRPPFTFSCNFDLPPDCETRLILGEISLIDASKNIQATQSFTITADLQELLNALNPPTPEPESIEEELLLETDDIEEEDYQELFSEPQPLDEEESLDLYRPVIELMPTPKYPQPLQFQPAPHQPLPAQIYNPDPTQKQFKSVELPKLPKIQLPEPDPQEVEEEVENDLDLLDDDFAIFPEMAKQQLAKAEAEIASISNLEAEIPPEESTVTPILTIESEIITVEPTEPSPLSDDSVETDLEVSTNPIQIINEFASTDQENLSEVDLDSSSSDSAVEDYLQFSEQELLEEEETFEEEEELLEDEEVEPELSPFEYGFQGLKIQERFWLRLNALAIETESLFEESEDDQDNLDIEEDDFESTDDEQEDLEEDDVESTEDEQEDLKLAAPEAEVIEYEQEYDHDDAEQLADYPQSLDIEVDESEKSVSAQESLHTDDDYYQTVDIEGYDTDTEDLDQLLPDLFANYTGVDQWLETKDLHSFSDSAIPQAMASPSLSEDILPETEDILLPAAVNNVVLEQTNQEIVVEEELSPELPISAPNLNPLAASPPTKPLPFPIYEDIPLPIPELFLPSGELISGQTATIGVKFPVHPARVYVKLWIQDRQSRFLLDVPRSLMDFIPNEFGEMQGSIDLIIPFGSLEILFEAIAVDMYSQRESRKVTIERTILPPNLPSLSLDEFEE